jgi:hypothetical protein
MRTMAVDEIDRVRGLCASCVHAREIVSDRGSRFVLCRLSVSDERFSKYPHLPVHTCSGYARAASESKPL